MGERERERERETDRQTDRQTETGRKERYRQTENIVKIIFFQKENTLLPINPEGRAL